MALASSVAAFSSMSSPSRISEDSSATKSEARTLSMRSKTVLLGASTDTDSEKVWGMSTDERCVWRDCRRSERVGMYSKGL